MMLVVSLIWLASVSPISGLPLSSAVYKNFAATQQEFPEEGSLFEGDIILQPEQLSQLKYAGGEPGVKTLISDPTALWPNRTVYYEFAPGEFSLTQKYTIVAALHDIMSASCVRFIPRTTERTYLILRNNGKGCAAAVGYHNLGPLDLYLGGPACQTRGTIQHELLHSLGFWHEHTRQDRDSYISIVWKNIQPGKEFNFFKRAPSEITNLNLPYDYGSVLHYRGIAFAKIYGTYTIVPRYSTSATNMGQRVRFSQVDIAKLNRLYMCPGIYYLGDDVEGQEYITGKVEPPDTSSTMQETDMHTSTESSI